MRWAQEAYDRLMDAQRNRPDPVELKAWEEAQKREAVNATIKRRLPKVI